MKPLKILVTGAGGFIGKMLSDELELQGHEVIRLQRSNPLGLSNVEVHDLRDLVKIPANIANIIERHQPEVTMHLAWMWVTNTQRDNPEHFSVNLTFTQHLVDAIQKNPSIRFIGIGSQAEYGPHDVELQPDTPCHPIVNYGKAKLAAGIYALEKLPGRSAWIRALTNYGPGDDPNKFIPYLLKSYFSGVSPAISPGEQNWDWLHVKDSVQALILAAEHKVTGVHILASEELCKLKDVSLKLFELVKKQRPDTPPPLIGARPYNPNELFLLSGNSRSLRKLTGWKPEISLDEGLRDLVEHWTTRNPIA